MVGLLVQLVISFLMPVTNTFVPVAGALYQRLGLPVVPIWVTPVATVAAAFMAYPRWVLGRIFQTMDETGELFVGVAMLTFAVNEVVRLRRERA